MGPDHYIVSVAGRKSIRGARPGDTFSSAHTRIREAFPGLHSSRRKELVTSGEVPTVVVAGIVLVCDQVFDRLISRLKSRASGESAAVADQPPEMADA